MAFAGEIWQEKGWNNIAKKGVVFVFEGGVVGVAMDEYGRRAIVRVEGGLKQKALQEAISQLRAHKLHQAGKVLVVACDGQWVPAALAEQLSKLKELKALEFSLGEGRFVAWAVDISVHFAPLYREWVEGWAGREVLASAYILDTLWICYRGPSVEFVNCFVCRSLSQYVYLHECVAQAVGATSPRVYLLGDAVALGWSTALRRWFRISERMRRTVKNFSPVLSFDTYGFLLDICNSLWERAKE